MSDQKTLLMIIDLQKGWRYEDVTEYAMLRTVELCRRFKGDVIHCCFKNDPDSLFFKELNWTEFMEPKDTDAIPEIAELNLPTYWQSTYSRVNEETMEIMKKYDRVYLAGVFTDISIAVTAMDIFDRNIPVSVVSDCVATLHGRPVHEAILRSLDHAIGTKNIVKSADI